MTQTKAKTIKLLLNDGSLKGLISVFDSGWYSGEMYSSPRDKVDELLINEACNRYGVYLLLSSSTVYVGQSKNLKQRIERHKLGKDWWERVILLTTIDDSLIRSDIDYLESSLIDKASKCKTLDCDNKNKGQEPKVDKYRKVELEQYLEEALFLLELIGINVFSSPCESKNHEIKTVIVPPAFTETEATNMAKKEAIHYLNSNGIKVIDNVSYSKKQENKNCFWINPSIDFVEDEWALILNNQFTKTIQYLVIPKGSLRTSKQREKGFVHIRFDKSKHCMDLQLNDETLIDSISGINFTKFFVKKLTY